MLTVTYEVASVDSQPQFSHLCREGANCSKHGWESLDEMPQEIERLTQGSADPFPQVQVLLTSEEWDLKGASLKSVQSTCRRGLPLLPRTDPHLTLR